MKIAVVTGASTGIGRAIAISLGKNDYEVYLVARRKDKLGETQKLMDRVGGKGRIFIADLASLESVNKLIREIKNTTDHINVLLNVAGIWHGASEVYADKDFEGFDQKVILDTYNVGTISPTLLAHAFIPLMPKKSKIINISGTFESGARGWLPYFVSKKAIEDLTIGLSQELKDKDIQVNCISPSDTATEEYKKYFPQYIKDAIEPEEIAEFATYLCSDKMNDTSGKIFVLKKNKEPYDAYHT